MTETTSAEWDPQIANELTHRLVSVVENERRIKAANLRSLVHFTDFGALQNIVRTKELWFSPVEAMNDFQEISAGKELIYREAEPGGQLLSAIDPIRNNYPNLWTSISDEFRHRISHDLDETFIGCWSEFGDELLPDGRQPYDVLSMWRAYGASGNGVALVFDPVVLSEHSFLSAGVVSSAVHYHTAREFISRVQHAFSDFALQVVALSDEDRALYESQIVGSFAEICFVLSVTHKHPAFEDEREWRFIWNRKPWSADFMLNEIKATNWSKGILQRLAFPFNERTPPIYPQSIDLSSALKRVMIGPCEDRLLKSRGVAQMMIDEGLDQTEVLTSLIPFRA